MDLTLSQEHVVSLASLAYAAWSREYDLLKAVKEEKYDGSADWTEFHAERLARHTASEAAARSLRDAITAYCLLK